jgi:hypothetical protein
MAGALLIGIASGYTLAYERYGRVVDNGADGSQQINSFDECVKSGNPIQTSYPEVCASGNQRFTNKP